MEFSRQILQYPLPLGSIYNLSKLNSLCFGKTSKFPVFSLTGIFVVSIFPVPWVACLGEYCGHHTAFSVFLSIVGAGPYPEIPGKIRKFEKC